MKEVRQWVKKTLGLEEQTVQLKVLQQGRAGQALEMAEEVMLWGRLVKGRAVGGRSERWQEAISHGALLTCLSLWFYSEKNVRVIAVFWAEARYEAHQESQGKIRIRDCKPIEGKCNIPGDNDYSLDLDSRSSIHFSQWILWEKVCIYLEDRANRISHWIGCVAMRKK